jgi:hypothetical protein
MSWGNAETGTFGSTARTHFGRPIEAAGPRAGRLGAACCYAGRTRVASWEGKVAWGARLTLLTQRWLVALRRHPTLPANGAMCTKPITR